MAGAARLHLPGGLLLVGIDHLNAPRGTTTLKRPRLGELVLPLFSLVVLLVPFLPVLPDRWPVLQALAGPLGAIVWLGGRGAAGVGVVAVAADHGARDRALEPDARSPSRSSSRPLAVAGLAAQRLTGTALFPSGDEPHYLVIAQSLWRDGDLKIENNHQRGDYREYYPGDLEPHYLTRGTDGEIYSIHPIGIAVLLAPVYALAGYKGAVWSLIADGRARRRDRVAMDGERRSTRPARRRSRGRRSRCRRRSCSTPSRCIRRSPRRWR